MTDQRVSNRQQRARAAAEARRRHEARRRQLTIGGVALAVVLVVVGAMVAIKLTGGKGSSSTAASTPNAVSPAVIANLNAAPITGVPQNALDTFTSGSNTALKVVSGQPPLKQNKKPEVLYVGAEYCPYCAAERWPLVIALSRFGTFTGLETTTSASNDVAPNTATLSFQHATYSSPYLSFTAIEEQDRQGNPLQPVPADVKKLMTAINGQNGGIPFVDFANKYYYSGAHYDPTLLQGLDHAAVARAAAQHAGQQPGAQIDALADVYTAAICQLTGDQPAKVCGTPTISSLEKKLGS